jgi:uncharacterized protein (DUF433 family)
VFTGTRVLVQTLFNYIEGGDDLNDFLRNYPSVSKETAINVLEMAKKSLTTEKSSMEILLDESVPVNLKADIGAGYEVKTVGDMGWLGKKNGEPISLIFSNGFNYFITVDRNLRHQQNLEGISITIFLLQTFNNRRQTLQTLLQKVKEKIEEGSLPKVVKVSWQTIIF